MERRAFQFRAGFSFFGADDLLLRRCRRCYDARAAAVVLAPKRAGASV
jgi:hypothetical protein